MKKIFLLSGTVLCSFLFLLSACVSSGKYDSEKAMSQARDLIVSGKAQCVLVRNGAIVYQQKGRGVAPLLTLYKTQRDKMKGAVVVDKVIGRAAASIAICGEVRHVHGEIMSEDAAEFLKEHNITSSSTLMVKRILNRKRNGLCPLEQSVLGIRDPRKALRAMEKKIREMQRKPVRKAVSKKKKG